LGPYLQMTMHSMSVAIATMTFCSMVIPSGNQPVVGMTKNGAMSMVATNPCRSRIPRLCWPGITISLDSTGTFENSLAR